MPPPPKLAAALLLSLTAGHAHAAPPTVLYNFDNGTGWAPYGSLLAVTSDRLYGTTFVGGTHNDGIVFELSAASASSSVWTETVLTSFNNATIGEYPNGNLIADHLGNLYGTLYEGTASGFGAVFQLSPPAAANAPWTETTLVTFTGANGQYPLGSLIRMSGKYYGTTYQGGVSGNGIVFELAPPSAGHPAWSETVLTSFTGTNGQYPLGSLIADSAGNLYGTTERGGSSNDGTVFKLAPPISPQTAWTESVLFTFTGTNGEFPHGSLIKDSAGNFYGTTGNGGGTSCYQGCGTVFELSPPVAPQTAWTQTILTAFTGTNGEIPEGSLVADSAGNLYGTTSAGGADSNGTVFKLARPTVSHPTWITSVLTSFNGTNGAAPAGSLIIIGGKLFGTAVGGGPCNCGTVYKLAR